MSDSFGFGGTIFIGALANPMAGLPRMPFA